MILIVDRTWMDTIETIRAKPTKVTTMTTTIKMVVKIMKKIILKAVARLKCKATPLEKMTTWILKPLKKNGLNLVKIPKIL